jgi:hypothetical protein
MVVYNKLTMPNIVMSETPCCLQEKGCLEQSANEINKIVYLS